MTIKKYQHVVVAGTFDHLHRGHQALLERAFAVGKRVTIGLVKAPFIKPKLLAEQVESYQTRRSALQNYLNKSFGQRQYTIFPLKDIYGNAATDDTIDALIVTRETYANGRKINAARLKNRKKTVKLIKVPMEKSKDQKIIRSERIRRGEIDRRGKVYFDVFKGRKKMVLPESLRSLMRKPLGRTLKILNPKSEILNKFKSSNIKFNSKMIITVGDIVTSEMIKIRIIPDLQIVDFRAMRKPVRLAEIKIKPNAFKVRNAPGVISVKSAKSAKSAIGQFVKTGKRQQIIVRGEEDLLALPAILLAPLGGIVLYGQWDLKSAVLVQVNEEIKEKIVKILKRF